MSVLVEQQDEQINVIEEQAAVVEKDVEAGYVSLRVHFGRKKLTTYATVSFQSAIYRKGRRFRQSSTEEEVDLLHHLLDSPHYHRDCGGHRGCSAPTCEIKFRGHRGANHDG